MFGLGDEYVEKPPCHPAAGSSGTAVALQDVGGPSSGRDAQGACGPDWEHWASVGST